MARAGCDRQHRQAGEWVGEDQGEARYSIWAPGEGEAHRRRASVAVSDSASEARGDGPEGLWKAPGVQRTSTVGSWRSLRTRPLVWTVADDGEAAAIEEADGATALQGFLMVDGSSMMRRP
jgi:hypothetical protein